MALLWEAWWALGCSPCWLRLESGAASPAPEGGVRSLQLGAGAGLQGDGGAAWRPELCVCPQSQLGVPSQSSAAWSPVYKMGHGVAMVTSDPSPPCVKALPV